MVSLPLLVFFTLLASLSVHFTSVLSIEFIAVYSFVVGLRCGLSSPLSLHGHTELAGTGSALQGALKMAGAAFVLWFFASEHTGTAEGLLSGLFILSLICFALIAFAQFRANRTAHQHSSPDRN
ncbi:hypothetical protein ACU60T_24235 [Klebsiella aerogenes]